MHLVQAVKQIFQNPMLIVYKIAKHIQNVSTGQMLSLATVTQICPPALTVSLLTQPFR